MPLRLRRSRNAGNHAVDGPVVAVVRPRVVCAEAVSFYFPVVISHITGQNRFNVYNIFLLVICHVICYTVLYAYFSLKYEFFRDNNLFERIIN